MQISFQWVGVKGHENFYIY